MEDWQTIENFPDYEVSNLWKVRHKKTKVELIITFSGNNATVTLIKEGKRFTRSLSKLVVIAFGPKN